MRKTFLLSILCFLFCGTLKAQSPKLGNSLLWKVTGKNLSKPSYLFGTFHLLSSGFVDTMQTLKTAYKSADAVVGELVIDSTLRAPMMEASVLKGTSLKQVLPEALYSKTSDWFTKEASMDLTSLNILNPIAVLTVAMAITQQKYFPNKPGELQLDSYFQEQAKKDGKKVMGLETIQMQIKAIFGQLSIQRQVELLDETLKDEKGLKELLRIMNNAYISQNLTDLQELM